MITTAHIYRVGKERETVEFLEPASFVRRAWGPENGCLHMVTPK